MKRSVWAGIISATVCAAVAASSASCTWMPENQTINDASLSFRFARTKADSYPDTSSFILKVLPAGGTQALYEGLYGSRPAELKVPAGTYEVSAFSRHFTSPDFDSPLYGDKQVVVAKSGENLAVSFICKAANSGVDISFSDRYKSRYPGKLVIRQNEGQLSYSYSEHRTAWLFPGETSFHYNDGTAENMLFKRFLQPGELCSLTLDASANETESSFSISVDTSFNRKDELVVIGEGAGGDGLSMATAYSASQLASADCAGDTVWVWGYIVGGLDEDGTADFDCGSGVTATALVIADSDTCRTSSTCAVLNLTKAAHKSALRLDDPAIREAVMHHKIYARGKATTYKKYPALTNLSEYLLE